MTSESSVSSGSRIGQFGLYRGIDARTEEFLKLSRKRQIRQGCACAAASTAITVTVVIVLLFVFEFSLNSSTNLENTLKSNWITLMNDTSGESSFSSKLTTTNIDKTTLMLLPLLFKAIKKNAFLEKLLEDHSSSIPPYVKKDTNNYNLNQNTLVTRNWFKMPTTKLVAIEYKTSPVVYYRDPTKNIEHYTKIRKIRDYQRVFNYVDKMINEKVYIRPTAVPLLKSETYTGINSNYLSVNKVIPSPASTAPMTHAQKTTAASNNDAHEKHNFHCKCPKKFGMLLQKILAGINKLLPKIIANRKKLLDEEKIQITPSFESELKLSEISSPNMPVKPIVFNTAVPLVSPPMFKSQNKNYRFVTESNHSTKPNIYFHNNIISPSQAKSSDRQTTISKNYMKDTDVEIITQSTSVQFINKYKNIINRKMVLSKNEHKINKNAITTKPFNQPFLEWANFGDILVSSPTPKFNNTNNNEVYNFTETTLNYFNDIEYKIDQLKHEIIPSFPHKKQNSTEFALEETKFTDINVDQYKKIVFLPTQINEIKKHTQSTQSEKEIVAQENDFKYRFNSNEIHDKVIKNNINKTNAQNLNVNPITYVDEFDENKNTYRLLKSNVMSFHNKKQQTTPKSVVYLKSNSSTTDRVVTNETYFNKINEVYNKTIYYIIEKGIDSIMIKNIRLEKALSIKPQGYEDHHNLDHNITLGNLKYKENVLGDKTKFINGETSEIIRQPENTIDKQKQYQYRNQVNFAHKIASRKPESTENIIRDDYEFIPDEFSKTTTQTENTMDKQKLQKNKNQNNLLHKITSRKPESKENIIGDEAEFLPEEFSEITRQPENTIDKPNKNVYPKKQTFEFTWEDLKIENIPAWKSMVPESKPIYLEVLRNDLKHEVQEDHDYNIQSNFYDLNL